MKTRLTLPLVFVVSLLSGCASNVIDNLISEQDYDGLYLRGVFTWWEADEKYKLVEVSSQLYATQIALIADGQPYDFKFADENWTPGMNCGYANNSSRIVTEDDLVSADCDTVDQNFRFTPQESGTFEFSIDFNGFGSPKVLVKRLTD
ncbi:hypothetical protein [Paraglaciecola aestuariivivens]